MHAEYNAETMYLDFDQGTWTCLFLYIVIESVASIFYAQKVL